MKIFADANFPFYSMWGGSALRQGPLMSAEILGKVVHGPPLYLPLTLILAEELVIAISAGTSELYIQGTS